METPTSSASPSDKQFNLFADKRPEFTARPDNLKSGFEIHGAGDVIVARTMRGGQTEFQDECNARMLSFAGKLHWALGNTTSFFKCAAQDLRVIAQMGDLSRMAEAIQRVAASLAVVSDLEHKAYDGALLTGNEAAKFDASWQQNYTSIPSDEEISAVLERWRHHEELEAIRRANKEGSATRAVFPIWRYVQGSGGVGDVAQDLNVVAAFIEFDREYIRRFPHRESTALFKRSLAGLYQAVSVQVGDALAQFRTGTFVRELGEPAYWPRYSENPEAYEDAQPLLERAQQLNKVAEFLATADGSNQQLAMAVGARDDLLSAVVALHEFAAEQYQLTPEASANSLPLPQAPQTAAGNRR